MKKRVKMLLLVVALTAGILGTSMVSQASCSHKWVLYRRYIAMITYDPCPTKPVVCITTVNHYEDDYRCSKCGDMYHDTTEEIVSHSYNH